MFIHVPKIPADDKSRINKNSDDVYIYILYLYIHICI